MQLSSQSQQTLNQSTVKSIARKKSQQQIIPELPDIQKYDTNKLFQQFKRHLLREDKNQLNKNVTIDNTYKDLLCDLKKSKQIKLSKLQKLSTKRNQLTNLSRLSSSNLANKSTVRNPFTQLRNKQGLQVSKIQKSSQAKQFTLDKSNVNEFSKCKFNQIRPMTTDNKFRINSNKSRLAVNNMYAQSRLLGQSGSKISSSNLNENQTQQCSQTLQLYSQKSLFQIKQSTLMIQLQQSQLQQEISSLKQSLNKLKKQLQEVNRDLQIQARNQEKYKHISYLATSIQNQTDYIKLQNMKGYGTMVNRQDQTIGQLKRFRMNLRKEKDQMENVYIQQINDWVKVQQEKAIAKKREFLFSSTSTPKEQEQTNQKDSLKDHKQSMKSKQKDKTIKDKLIQSSVKFHLLNTQPQQNPKPSKVSSQLSPKALKKLIDQLDSIIELLQQKQVDYEQIKEQECTKVRLGKINKALLSKQRVQILERIEEFQDKFDMKIGSIENLILRVYRVLFEDNQKLEIQCMKLTETKQQLQQDLKETIQKHQLDIDTFQSHYKLIAEENMNQKRLNESLKKTSTIFIKIVQAFYTMLFKFRYMFSLALTLDIDKKSFRDCVIQIDSTFSSGLFFNFKFEKHLITSTQRHDIINEKEFKEILQEKAVQEELAQQLTDMMFNDHRINLIMHKSWIENRMKYLCAGQVQENDILDIVQSVRMDCEQIYKMKLPSFASLFLTCFKCISMSKYQTKLAASSHERGSIFLPTGPTKKFHYLHMIDQNNESYQKSSDNSYQQSKKNIIFTTQNSQIEQPVFQKDPRKIIYSLQVIKNKSHKKFKALNFACEGKAYKYNEQIVIPDFPMINEEGDF